MSGKFLCKSIEEFWAWCDGHIRDRTDATIPKMYPPDSFPCMIAYFTRDISNSMTWGESLSAEYIYPGDFNE